MCPFSLVSFISCQVGEIEEQLTSARRELARSEETNQKLQRDLKEVCFVVVTMLFVYVAAATAAACKSRCSRDVTGRAAGDFSRGCGPVNQSVRWQLSERRAERFGIRGSRASLIGKLLLLATACILPPNPHSHFCWT